MSSRIELSREQILTFRRRVGQLEERMPAGAKSLRVAAWAGLQDSSPRAALLSIHARVSGADSSVWEHSSLVQMWGPRFSAYVVAASDVAVFSLGRMPENARGKARAQTTALRLGAFLNGRRMPFGEAGKGMRVPHNSLRYAAATGTVLMRWDGARQPVIWTVAGPKMEAREARFELARRYLHVFGPSTTASFRRWAGIGQAEARAAFEGLELAPVRTPIGDAWILAEDEGAFRQVREEKTGVRFLPSGDAYFLLWGADRRILVPDAKRQAQLWTTRVWPGALLVNGDIVGVWRRAGGEITIDAWRRLSGPEWEAVEAEAASLPLPGLTGPIVIHR